MYPAWPGALAAARPFFRRRRDNRGRSRQAGGMLDFALADGIARLTLNRPETRNAIPVAGWDAIADAAGRAAGEGARLLILAARGTAFSAGADISEFGAFRSDPAAAAGFRMAMRRGIDAVRDLPIPTIAAIHGACFGAGVALANACDIRLAGPAASFAITPAKFGISYPQEDVARLVALIGEPQAARLLFSARPIDPAEALRIGLIDRSEEDLEAEVEAFAAAVAGNDPESLRTLKQGLRLAASGIARDATQDRLFDDLLRSDVLAARLAERSRR